MSEKKSDLAFYLVVGAVLMISLVAVLSTKTNFFNAFDGPQEKGSAPASSDIIMIYSLSEWVAPALLNPAAVPGGIEAHVAAGAEALEWLGNNGYLVFDESVLKVPAKGRYLTPDLYASIRAKADADE